ncbi:MAG: sulfite exporter TauE/SafE family protein [Cytophagales bacterium]
MQIIGILLALLVGVSLGLIGSGGSILTVPILVYVMGVPASLATAYSLFIVGSTALVGGIQSAVQGKVNYRTAIVFGIPSIAAVYATRLWIMPMIPKVLFSVGSFEVTKDIGLMLVFAIFMGLASISMIRSGKKEKGKEEKAEIRYNYPMILLEGALVGVLTGLVGAGGGFLIIPALVLLARLPMTLAVGTSLFIIAAKSLIGFIGDLQGGETMDWTLLISFTIAASTGIFIGNYLTKFVSGAKLKAGFGWFVLVMGIYIIVKELFLK